MSLDHWINVLLTFDCLQKKNGIIICLWDLLSWMLKNTHFWNISLYMSIKYNFIKSDMRSYFIWLKLCECHDYTCICEYYFFSVNVSDSKEGVWIRYGYSPKTPFVWRILSIWRGCEKTGFDRIQLHMEERSRGKCVVCWLFKIQGSCKGTSLVQDSDWWCGHVFMFIRPLSTNPVGPHLSVTCTRTLENALRTSKYVSNKKGIFKYFSIT